MTISFGGNKTYPSRMQSFDPANYEIVEVEYTPDSARIYTLVAHTTYTHLPMISHDFTFLRSEVLVLLNKTERFYCHGIELTRVIIDGFTWLRTNLEPIPADFVDLKK